MDHTIKNLGMKIRERRINKGLTQDVLSLRAGLTKSYVSLLEAGKKVPAISTLARIATALGINLGNFFESSEDFSNVALVRKGERYPVVQRGTPFGYVYEALPIKKKNKIMEPFIVKVVPGKKHKKKKPEFVHSGEEFDYVLEGKMKYIVDNKEYILEEGDAIYFDSTLKHSIEAVGDTPAISLSVNATLKT